MSLGHGVFFGLGAYCIGMHLMLTIGTESVYGSDLPDFMVWNQVKELPLFWKPFSSFPAAVLRGHSGADVFALLFGFLAFRSRIKGVYFAIITQALALVGLAGVQPKRNKARRDERPDRFQNNCLASGSPTPAHN